MPAMADQGRLLMSVMHAMVLDQPKTPLMMRERPVQQRAGGEILLEIAAACGVCRTDLHVVDGELPQPKLPVVPRHEIVGRVAAIGPSVTGFTLGERVGVPWFGATCGVCPYRRNLCDRPLFRTRVAAVRGEKNSSQWR